MVHKCKDCGALFSHSSAMYRHRSKSCKQTVNTLLVSDKGTKKTGILQNETGILQNGTGILQNETGISQNETQIIKFEKTNDNRWKCNTCKKSIIKQSKRLHSQQACFRNLHGYEKCIYCGDDFENSRKRQRHEISCGKSLAKSSEPMQINFNINNNQNNNQNITNHVVQNNTIDNSTNQHVQHNQIDNSTTQYVKNTIDNSTNQFVNNNTIDNITNQFVLNTFGREDVVNLCDDAEKLKRELRDYVMKDGLDGVAKVIGYQFFNKEFPQNQTIRKRVKNDDFVDIHVGNNQWESQTLETAMRNVTDKTEPILGCVLDPVFSGDLHLYTRNMDTINALFTDVLVPLGYSEILDTWRDYLKHFNPLLPHKIVQERQIAMRKIKKILYDLTLRLNAYAAGQDHGGVDTMCT